MSEVLLAARNVSKSYSLGKRELEVLRGVTLEVERGEFLALRGASGAVARSTTPPTTLVTGTRRR